MAATRGPTRARIGDPPHSAARRRAHTQTASRARRRRTWPQAHNTQTLPYYSTKAFLPGQRCAAWLEPPFSPWQWCSALRVSLPPLWQWLAAPRDTHPARPARGTASGAWGGIGTRPAGLCSLAGRRAGQSGALRPAASAFGPATPAWPCGLVGRTGPKGVAPPLRPALVAERVSLTA